MTNIIGHNASAQDNSVAKDSVLLESLTQGMEAFFTDPYNYKQRFIEAEVVVDRLIKEKPESVYFKTKKVDITNYHTYFLRRELKDEDYLNKMYDNISLRQHIGDSCGLSISYRKLGVFWRTKKKYKEALSFVKKAQIQSLHCGDSLQMLLNDLAEIKIIRFTNKQFDFDSAYAHFISRATLLNQSRGIAASHQNYAGYLIRNKRHSEGKIHLDIAERVSEKDNDLIRLKAIYASSGNYYRKIKEYDKSIALYKKSIAINQKIKDSFSLSSTFLGISNSYSAKKEYEQSLEYYIKYKRIQARLKEIENSKLISGIASELNYKRQKSIDSIAFIQKATAIKMNAEQKSQRKFWIVVCSLLVLLLVSIIGYFKYKLRSKKTETKNSLLKQEVSLKSNEVTNLLVETVEHIQTKEVLSKNLKRLSTQEEGVSLKGILTDLKVENLADSKRLFIKENISKLQSDFIHKLKIKHPNLTKTDIEVATFIRLGLSRKQIASLRNTTVHASKSSRYRLNKKLHIEDGQDTVKYLKSI
ncbi:tetratricopeptide repeat protein [Dokdonia sp.]